MKKTVHIFGILFLLAMIAVSCQNSVDHSEQQESESHSKQEQAVEEKNMADCDTYYLCDGKKIPLWRMDGKFYVLFYLADEQVFKDELAKAGGVLSNEIAWKGNSLYSYSIDMTGSGAEKFIDVKSAIIEGSYEQCAAALSSTLYWGPFYKTESGDETGITEMFMVKLKPGTDLMQLEEFAKENSVEMLGGDNNDYFSNRYYFACTRLSKGNALEMANLFYESGLFEDAPPAMTMNVVFY